MDKEYLSKKQQEFMDANNKEGFYVLAAADAGGISREKLDMYLHTELSPDRLLEIVAAIMDEVPDKTMKVLADGNIPLGEMRSIRLSCRNDVVMTTLSEEVNRCVTDIENIGAVTDASEQFKKFEKMLSDISKTVTKMQKDMLQKNSEAAESRKAETPAVSVAKSVHDLKPESIQADKKVKKEEKVENAATPPKADMKVFVGNVPVDVDMGSRSDDQRILSYNKMANGSKMVDKEARAAEIKKILKRNPSDDQIEALTTAVKEGVSAEYLKFYADKKASPEKLAGITRLYKALFDPQYKATGGQMA